MKVEYKPHPGITSNIAGIRVLILSQAPGALPPFLLISVDNSASYPRCYFSGLSPGLCSASALLSNPTETQSLKYRKFADALFDANSGSTAQMCRVPFDENRCMSPQPGYIIDIGFGAYYEGPIQHGRLLFSDFEALPESMKNQYFVFENNAGRKYLAACHSSCGICNSDLVCTSCLDGSPVSGDGTCPVSSCSSISSCVRCGAGNTCDKCSSPKYLALDKMSCIGSCPTGSAPRYSGFPGKCLSCIPKCELCDPFNDCNACLNDDHLLMSNIYKDRLPSGQTHNGITDCFSPTDISDYFYKSASHFLPCKANCKRCTTANDCQECGNHLNPGATYYFLNGANPPVCLDASSCSAANHRFIVPGSTPPTCYTCPVGQFYVDGSNPPQCTLCDTGAVWKDTPHLLCKQCPVGCSSCTSDTGCQACSNPNEFIKTSGGGCTASCSSGEMEVLGPPKRCQTCPPGCTTCSESSGCSQCSTSYFMDSSNTCQSCPPQCLTCTSQSECTQCLDSNFYLNPDKQTCSLSCPGNSKPTESPVKSCIEIEDSNASTTLKLEEKGYIDEPSRVRLVFDRKIVSSASRANTRLLLLSEDKQKTLELELKAISIGNSDKILKIFFKPVKSIEKGKLIITFGNKGLVRAASNRLIQLESTLMEVDFISYYSAEAQLEGFDFVSNLLLYLALGVLPLMFMDSYASVFDLIRLFQIIDYLLFLNVDHPSNLKVLLESLSTSIIENLQNLLRNVKDDLCSIEKEKFEEQGIGCYIFEDNGSYFTIVLLFVALYLVVKLVTMVAEVEFLGKRIIKQMNHMFWVEFLEAIRLDLHISGFLVLFEIELVRENLMTALGVNFGFVVLMFATSGFLIIYQFWKIFVVYSKYRKSIKFDKEWNHGRKNKDKRQSAKLEKDDQFAQSTELRRINAEDWKPSGARRKELGVKGKLLKNKLSNITEGPTCSFNEDNKTEKFYQRNHRPIVALKDLLVSGALVGCYDSPRIQTTTISLIIFVFFILDAYYKPEVDKKENNDLIIYGLFYFLVTLSLAVLSFVQDRITREEAFYYFGYPCVVFVLVIVIRGLVNGIISIFRGAKKLCGCIKSLEKTKKKKMARKTPKNLRNQISRQREPGSRQPMTFRRFRFKRNRENASRAKLHNFEGVAEDKKVKHRDRKPRFIRNQKKQQYNKFSSDRQESRPKVRIKELKPRRRKAESIERKYLSRER